MDEVQEADLLLHVVDISHPNFEEHIDSVNQILKEINSLDKPTYMVFNKIDAYEPKSWDETELVEERGKKHYSLGEWEETWMSTMNGQALFISALNKENLKEFRNRVYDAVRQIHVTRFPLQPLFISRDFGGGVTRITRSPFLKQHRPENDRNSP